MPPGRTVIVNADDFGYCAPVNAGVIEAHRAGIVSSASLMIRQPGTAEAIALSRDVPRLSLGLHVDLGEWSFRNGAWEPRYETVRIDDEASVRDECLRQLGMFRDLVGVEPTHLDAHQHAHLKEPVASVMTGIARSLRVPLRHFDEHIRYCGSFYGQTTQGLPLPSAITLVSWISMIRSLPDGLTEIACHPATRLAPSEECRPTTYWDERFVELEVLTDPAVTAHLAHEGITLRSFGDLHAAT
jgi:predicted glycoside hydrolase/deacetylase ChbG (UPF0249 family)